MVTYCIQPQTSLIAIRVACPQYKFIFFNAATGLFLSYSVRLHRSKAYENNKVKKPTDRSNLGSKSFRQAGDIER